jgi:Centrosomin N-terminal motif 1
MATAGHLGIATPRSDSGPSELSINPDDISFGSQEASFKSPSKLNKENQPPKHPHSFLNRLQKPTGSTPLSEIKNPQNPIVRPPVRGSNEFTPMLKSASKNRLRKAMMGQPTPSRLRNSNLPQMMEEDEDSVMVEGETGVEVSTANLQNEEKLADMSSVSASFQKLPSRSPGSNDGAALLTLREQEKVSHSLRLKLMQVIDEMRKENFSLKLKIFFMQDRLGKLAPEHIQAVLQEVPPTHQFKD